MKKSRIIIVLSVTIVLVAIASSCATTHNKCAAYGSYGDSHRKQGVVVCRSW